MIKVLQRHCPQAPAHALVWVVSLRLRVIAHGSHAYLRRESIKTKTDIFSGLQTSLEKSELLRLFLESHKLVCNIGQSRGISHCNPWNFLNLCDLDRRSMLMTCFSVYVHVCVDCKLNGSTDHVREKRESKPARQRDTEKEMMMLDFITFISRLLPLLEGLCGSNP